MYYMLFSKSIGSSCCGGLGKLSMDREFENLRLLSPSSFGIVVWTQAKLSNSFLTRIILQMVILKNEYMKLNDGKVVDYMTRGSCILTDSVKSCDDYSNLVHNMRVGPYVDSDKTNLSYLVG